MTVVSRVRNALGRAQGFGWCYRCGGTWDYTESHTTPYGKGGEACFPLCEACWLWLETPAARLPYYEALRDEWTRQAMERADTLHIAEIQAQWPQIEAAVKAGR